MMALQPECPAERRACQGDEELLSVRPQSEMHLVGQYLRRTSYAEIYYAPAAEACAGNA
jgi:hypothetical protein